VTPASSPRTNGSAYPTNSERTRGVLDSHEAQNPDEASVDHVLRLASMTFPHALNVGNQAPHFELPNADGHTTRLSALLEGGPVVLVFYRGAWCPYCNAQLRQMQSRLAEMTSLGATLAAVSPQTPDASAAFAGELGLGFEVLSDTNSYVASDYGITFEFTEVDTALFIAVGNDLSKVNGRDAWVLPAPATFLIAPGGRIEYARIDPNFTVRPDLDEIMNALRQLMPRSA
jgi:peroxiredoxin